MDNSAPSGNNKHIKEFPAIDNKLHALTKKSLFEKQRAEAEAKRVREEAETKAVYESFVKSFDDDEGGGNPNAYPVDGGGYGRGGGGGGGGYERGGGGGGYTRGQQGGGYNDRGGRRFGGPPPPPMRGSMSGPGSLGPIPGPPPRKRGFEASFNNNSSSARRSGSGVGGDRGALLGFDDSPPRATPRGFGASDDEEEDDTAAGRTGGRAAGGRAEPALAKPTLRLAQLPPGTSTAAIKALIPGLTVDAVKILPPPPGGVGGGERRSMTAIVTLSQETAANDIDAAVHALQNKYLGFGFCLELHRHLSSAALESSTVGAGTGRGAGSAAGAAAHPFGAKPVVIEGAPNTQQFAPNQYRGIAPPTSYASTPRGPLGPILHVPVRQPSDIKELRVIHKTIESLLTHGPAFEALLMSRPEVQREPRWAWLWDARSGGGVYYRYRLWEMMTSSSPSSGRYVPLFEDSAAWKAPESGLPFEFVTRLDEFVEDAAYNSDDDEEDSGDEAAAGRAKEDEGGPGYLNPLARAKLTHLLARLPTTTGKLRKGDVARVTAFAITHAGRGADEVVEALVANVAHPYSFTSANPSYRPPPPPTTGGEGKEVAEKEDTTPATLNALHLISSLLSSCSTSRIRHAWRYRSLIESALRRSKTFEYLAGLERRMGWGRMRGEKWRRSVGQVLSLWEGWCVFPAKAQEGFVEAFKVPVREEKEVEEKKGGGRWKAVERVVGADADVGGAEEGEDVDGEPMVEDEEEDLDGVPMEPSDEEDGDVDGEPMVVDEEEETYEPPPAETAVAEQPQQQESEVENPVRKRPKAEDMFADSGSEGE
jgi:U2-associated protein SR140